MEISPFQLLLLLILIIPLIRRVWDNLKKGDDTGHEGENLPEDPWSVDQDTESRYPQEAAGRHRPGESRSQENGYGASPQHTAEQPRGEQSWEDFFEGLEKVLSSDESEQNRQRESQREPASASYGRETAGTVSQRTRDASSRHPLEGPVYSESGHGARGASASAGGHSASGGSYGSATSSASGQSRRGTGDSRGSRPSSDPFRHKEHRWSDTGEEIEQELADKENPIYATLDDEPTVTRLGMSGRKNVKRILGDPERVRDGIMLKVILEPPRSRRGRPDRF
ncbi:hypothetical protein QA596_01275 [Balneolales bacterium ANBcel1]|nr:hypothetical protein [Balneolales bacterium ANBcel1]